MNSRRRFLANLGIGAAALMLRFRPETPMGIKPLVVASGEWREYRWVLMKAFHPAYRHYYAPIVIHRCPPEP